MKKDDNAAIRELRSVRSEQRALDRVRPKKRGRPSKLEHRVANMLKANSISFERQFKIGKYAVDFAFPAVKMVLEVQGCYWHACTLCGYENKRRQFLDKRRKAYIEYRGWDVRWVWEHDINANGESAVEYAIS